MLRLGQVALGRRLTMERGNGFDDQGWKLREYDVSGFVNSWSASKHAVQLPFPFQWPAMPSSCFALLGNLDALVLSSASHSDEHANRPLIHLKPRLGPRGGW